LWNKSTGLRALPFLSASDYSASGNAINNLGQVVGGSGNTAVLWQNNKNHTPQSLGVLSGQGWSSAFAINDLGQVVGWSGFIAFIWTRQSGMLDLNTLIPSSSGWSLSLPVSINALGQITGQGSINGQQHGFLLTPVAK
jgi:probable HAF family extracellular repeat protein